MRVYVDWPWNKDGAPPRAYIHTRKWLYLVGARTQVWTEEEGWTNRWRRVARSPENPDIYRVLHRRHR